MGESDQRIQDELAVEYERGGVRTSAIGVLIEDGRLLLVRVGDSHFLPGGGQEGAESLRGAVKREFLEETGLAVDVKELLLTVEYEPRRIGDGYGRYHKLVLIFTASRLIEGQEVRKLEADHEPTWVRLDELNDLKFVPDCADQLMAALDGELADHFEV